MKHENGSTMKLAGSMIFKWVVCLLVSAAILVPCVLTYNSAIRPPEGEVFCGSAAGMFCDIQAQVTVSDGKIVDVKLSGDEETPELGGVVLAEMPAKILEAQSANVDGKSGATVTGNAARQAVTSALVLAGLADEASLLSGETYTASAQGFGGQVVAEITVDGGKLVDVKLTGENETPGLGGAAIEEMPARILEAQSAAIDGRTGATLTSNAIKAAVTDAMTQAGMISEEVYVGSAQGTNGEVNAELTIVNGQVADMKLTGDVLSQAAVQAAINDALIQAGLTPEEIPDAPETEPGVSGDIYTAFAQGFGGEIAAEITVNEGKIVDVKLTGENETPGLGGAAIEEMPARILEAQSADVDGKTGATISSNAIRQAVADAMAQAGLGTAPAEEPGVSGDIYTASAQGFAGEVVAEITVSDGRIVDVKLTGENETPGLGGAAIEEMPARILEAQSADVDGRTGATLTSNAIKAAVTDAMTQAGLGAEEPAGTEPGVSGQVYTAKEQGFGGEIVAEITVEAGKIVDVKLTGEKETPGLGGAAIEEMPAKILEAQSADVDGKTGATISSNAIRQAVTDAMTQAGLLEAPQEEPAPEIEWVDLADAADGTYSAAAKGFGGDITVDVTLEGGKIVDVKIVGDSETPGLGAVAVEKMPQQLLNAQAMDVDGIAGATVSSTAIRKAFGEAMAKANVDAAKLENMSSQAVIEKTEEELDVDVVIVGAGGAGMSAAITAKQAGKNVILLEKMPYVGGNTTKASGGMNAAGTSKQAEAIAAASDEKIKASLEDSTVENFIIDTMAGGHELNDPALVRTMAEKSADAIDWLDEIGAPLPEIAATGGTVHMYLHEPEDGSAVGEYLVKVFSGLLEKMEIPVYLDTAATELISEDGQVVGVKAESDTRYYTIHAKAVILATGGFGANEEMYCSYRPDLKGTVTTNAPGATGDGIVMAQAVGADLVDIEQIQLHPTVFQDNGFLVSERLRSNGAILVNMNGQRFTNDLSTRDAVSAAELEQPGCCAFIVYDSQYADQSLYKKYVTNGLTVQGETLEELAAAMGLDAAATANFVETVAQWNDTVQNETPDAFGRNNGLVSLEAAPYYAIKIAPGIHHTMGGVKIDTETHVINTDGEIIPGLFAAGEVTGGVHGGNRIGGNAVADIVVFGRIAGSNACAFADAQ